MGSSISYEVPPKKQLKKLAKSKVSQEDLIRMKDRLRRVARKEHGVSRDSWTEVLNSIGVDDAKFVNNFFDQFDADGEEWFDYKHAAIYSALVARPDRRKKVEFCFRVYDRDSSGALDVSELTTLMLAVGRVLKQCNYALPGTTGKGSPSCDLTAKEEKRITKAAARIFDKMDRDEDDEISYKEFAMGADRKEIRAVLDYFEAIANAIPSTIERSLSIDSELDNYDDGDYATKKSKKGKKKAKKSKKKKGKSKSASASGSDAGSGSGSGSDAASSSKKGKSKKGKSKKTKTKKRVKKKVSKKGKGKKKSKK